MPISNPGAVLGRISASDAPVASAKTAETKTASPAAQTLSPNTDAGQLPPGIRRLLAEHNLLADDVPVRGGKLTREDIEAEVARRANASTAGVRIVPHDSMRRRIGEHMAHSVRTAPHVTALFEADFGAIIAHRNVNKVAYAEENANLTFTAYFIVACIEAMKAVPLVNSATGMKTASKSMKISILASAPPSATRD